jgi:hypothetical protein
VTSAGKPSGTPVVLTVEPSGGIEAGRVTLRVSAAEGEELREALHAADLHVSDVLELSETVEVLRVLAVTVIAAGGFKALSNVLVAFINRHRDKQVHVTVAGVEVDLKGYPEARAGRMLSSVLRERDAEQRRAWQRQLDGSTDERPGPGSPQDAGD